MKSHHLAMLARVLTTGAPAEDVPVMAWHGLQQTANAWREMATRTGLAPAMADALDVAAAVHTLVCLGAGDELRAILADARKLEGRAKRNHHYNRELHRREGLIQDVIRMAAADGDEAVKARAIAERLYLWPEVAGSPDKRADAADVIAELLVRRARVETIIERGMVALGLTRNRARTIASARLKVGTK